MSLDVYLYRHKKVVCECGREHLLEKERVYEANITHNLNTMAEEAGIYEHLWRPEEIGITTAKELVRPLADAVVLLKSDPQRFMAHNPSNGWGKYEGLVRFVEKYLAACLENPDAKIEVCR